MKNLSITIALILFFLSINTIYLLAQEVQQANGKITFLRVHDVGTDWGPASDKLDVEVVIKLNTQPEYAFGFKLRNDNNRSVRQGMLDILRDAFNLGWNVTVDFKIYPNKKNGEIIRVWLTK